MTDRDREYLWPIIGLAIAWFLAGWPGGYLTTVMRVGVVIGMIYYIALAPTAGAALWERLVDAIIYIVVPTAVAVVARWQNAIAGWDAFLGVYALALLGLFALRNAWSRFGEDATTLVEKVESYFYLVGVGGGSVFLAWSLLGINDPKLLGAVAVVTSATVGFMGGPTMVLPKLKVALPWIVAIFSPTLVARLVWGIGDSNLLTLIALGSAMITFFAGGPTGVATGLREVIPTVVPYLPIAAAVTYGFMWATGIQSPWALAVVFGGTGYLQHLGGGPTESLKKLAQGIAFSPRLVYALLMGGLALIGLLHALDVTPRNVVEHLQALRIGLDPTRPLPPPAIERVASVVSTLLGDQVSALILAVAVTLVVLALIVIVWAWRGQGLTGRQRMNLWGLTTLLGTLSGAVFYLFTQLPPPTTLHGQEITTTPQSVTFSWAVVYAVLAVSAAGWLFKGLSSHKYGQSSIAAVAIIGILTHGLYTLNEGFLRRRAPTIPAAVDLISSHAAVILSELEEQRQRNELNARFIQNDRRGHVKGPAELVRSYQTASGRALQRLALQDGEEVLIRTKEAPEEVNAVFRDRTLYYVLRMDKYGVPLDEAGWLPIGKVKVEETSADLPQTVTLVTAPTPLATPQISTAAFPCGKGQQEIVMLAPLQMSRVYHCMTQVQGDGRPFCITPLGQDPTCTNGRDIIDMSRVRGSYYIVGGGAGNMLQLTFLN